MYKSTDLAGSSSKTKKLTQKYRTTVTFLTSVQLEIISSMLSDHVIF